MIVVVVLILLGALLALQIRSPFFFTSDPISYSIEFAQIVNKPFLLAEVTTSTSFGDRRFLEQSIEAAVTSLGNSQSTDLPNDLRDFIDKYNLEDYSVVIKQNTEKMRVESTALKCGGNERNPEGWCVYGNCGTGRIEINPSALTCNALQKCCKEDAAAYEQIPGHNRIERCGPLQTGVCSEGLRPKWARTYEILKGTHYEYSCEQNRRDLGNLPECRSPTVNNGNTQACCAPLDAQEEISKGLSNTVTIPLLFKNQIGRLEITAR